ncbi:MAG: thioredoxin domain-containing protein [Bacteroidetes bacterium]|nr:thioredoxin domain-containing protein [Bacteroidota bacterium]
MNLLKHETSPYLLQHAANPVHWQPWGEAAFELARQTNKPVLLSIGYSSCHWCHVMAHESFENEEVAALMNQLYVNIKLDREEYPDIDHMYMDAVQAMTGSGGWPLNVFLTPDKKPFYGGTYFPPVRAYNRASWKEILVNVSQYYTQNNQAVQEQATQMMLHLKQASDLPTLSKIQSVESTKHSSDKSTADQLIFKKIMAQADTTEGGFGNAPKFPATFTIKYLLDYYAIYKEEAALKQACLSLDKMAMGGIYDHLGGGFARYSTDTFWIAPHFEKMLYDNALLIEVYSLAYAYTKNIFYKEIVSATVAWLQREMMDENTAFYSAQDADSEGVEGKYYTWDTATLKDLLGEQYELYKEYYQIKEHGNWEHTNILYTTYESKNNTSEETWKIIQQINTQLFTIRNQRIKPLTDDKVLLGWNALMNKALSTAAIIFDDGAYLNLAISNMKFLLSKMAHPHYLYCHTIKNDQQKIPAYLDDLAYLSMALIQLNIATAKPDYLLKAKEIIIYIEQHFKSNDAVLFNYTNHQYLQVPINKIETYDGAVPASNSVLCKVFDHLGYAFSQLSWVEQSRKMILNMQNFYHTYPTSFGVWAALYLSKNEHETQITIVGADAKKDLYALYNKMPHAYVTYVVSSEEENIESIKHKFKNGETLVYVCRNNNCLPPFTSIEDTMTVFFDNKF